LHGDEARAARDSPASAAASAARSTPRIRRYKRFFVTADTSHMALRTPLFYTQDANGFPLKDWTRFFVHLPIFWQDIVEDFVALP